MGSGHGLPVVSTRVSVPMTATGIPAISRVIASTARTDIQEPQLPNAVITTSQAVVISSMSFSDAGSPTYCFFR